MNQNEEMHKEYCRFQKALHLQGTKISVISVLKKVVKMLFKLVVYMNILLQNHVNLLTSNVNYSGCTAPLTSKVAFYIFIQQI